MRAELSEIESAILANSSSGVMNSSNVKETGYVSPYVSPQRIYNRERFNRRKCRKCQYESLPRCFRCFLCGSSDHMMFAYPSKKKK